MTDGGETILNRRNVPVYCAAMMLFIAWLCFSTTIMSRWVFDPVPNEVDPDTVKERQHSGGVHCAYELVQVSDELDEGAMLSGWAYHETEKNNDNR